MANLTETSTYDAGVYQIELTDPVIGGASGITNTPIKNLANRTKYLKDHVDIIESTYAPKGSPALTGVPTAPTAAVSNSTTQLATTAFVNAEITADAAPIAHVGSTGAAHGIASTTVAGFMSSVDKTKLDSVASGAQANTVTSVAGKTGAVSLSVGDIANAAPLTGAGASGSWAINAATVTNGVYTVGNQMIHGIKDFETAPVFNGGSVSRTVDGAGFGVRVTPSNTGEQAIIQFTNSDQSAQWSNLTATNNLLSCGTAFSAGSFNGNASGLNGTASALSIGGNATTATTSTNLNGGYVNGSSGTFSGDVLVGGYTRLSNGGDIMVSGGTDASFALYKNSSPFLSSSASNTVSLVSGQNLVLQGNNSTSPIGFFDGGGNNISHIGNNGTYYVGSDYRLKEQITDLSYGLNDVLKLKPRSYFVISESEIREKEKLPQIKRLGLIAQEVQAILPEIVVGDDLLAVDYSAIIPVLINAIKELNDKIDKLTK